MYNYGCSSLFAESNLDLGFVVIIMYKVSQGVSLPHPNGSWLSSLCGVDHRKKNVSVSIGVSCLVWDFFCR